MCKELPVLRELNACVLQNTHFITISYRKYILILNLTIFRMIVGTRCIQRLHIENINRSLLFLQIPISKVNKYTKKFYS